MLRVNTLFRAGLGIVKCVAMGVAVLCLSSAAAMHAIAAYPDRPIRFIVPSSAGSGPDVIARIFAHRLSAVLVWKSTSKARAALPMNLPDFCVRIWKSTERSLKPQASNRSEG